MTAKLLRIRGLVQGVNFRSSMQQQAAWLGVFGWVRNRLDGSVEALVCGDEAKVETIIAWARHGPSFAKVSGVEVFDSSDCSETEFEVRPSA